MPLSQLILRDKVLTAIISMACLEKPGWVLIPVPTAVPPGVVRRDLLVQTNTGDVFSEHVRVA